MTAPNPVFTIKCADGSSPATPIATYEWVLEKTTYMGEPRLTLRCNKFIADKLQGGTAVLEISPIGLKRWVISSGFFPTTMVDSYRKLKVRNAT